MYQQEKLPFTCSPTGAALSGTITDPYKIEFIYSYSI
jgi:hypothetical protein